MFKSFFYRARYFTAKFFGANPQVIDGPFTILAGQVFVAGAATGGAFCAGSVAGELHVAGSRAGQVR